MILCCSWRPLYLNHMCNISHMGAVHHTPVPPQYERWQFATALWYLGKNSASIMHFKGRLLHQK